MVGEKEVWNWPTRAMMRYEPAESRAWVMRSGLRVRWRSDREAVRRTITKEKRYGGAERAWEVSVE